MFTGDSVRGFYAVIKFGKFVYMRLLVYFLGTSINSTHVMCCKTEFTANSKGMINSKWDIQIKAILPV